MTRRYRSCLLLALLGACLASAPAVPAEQPLLPPDPSAPPVRIILTIPVEAGRLNRQVTWLDAALPTSRGFLRRAVDLNEADAIVQFTSYRRTWDDKGVSLDWWEGQLKLLSPSARADGRTRQLDRFTLLLIGRDAWDVDKVADLLARHMARALGRESRPKKADPI